MKFEDGYVEIDRFTRWGSKYMISWNKKEFRFSSDFLEVFKLDTAEFVNIFANKNTRKLVFVFFKKKESQNLFKLSRSNSRCASCSSMKVREYLKDNGTKKVYGLNNVEELNNFRGSRAIELTL